MANELQVTGKNDTDLQIFGESNVDFKTVFNSLNNNADHLLTDCINQTITLKSVLIKPFISYETDKATGEIKEIPRAKTIIFDDDDVTYCTLSSVFANNLINLIKTLKAYDKPIEGTQIKLIKINKDKKQFLSFELI